LPSYAMLGNRIAEARRLKGYTMKEAARRMSVTEKTFKKWEGGTSKPRANKAQMLAGVLGVSLLWILDGEEQFEPEASSLSQLKNLGQKIERMTQLQQELNELTNEVLNEVGEIQRIEDDQKILKD
jgi:transcriptional regulator with XRE-family HTH domain